MTVSVRCCLTLDATNNLTKLNPAQCAAANTVRARETHYGTPKVARMSGNTFGDNTLSPFNVSAAVWHDAKVLLAFKDADGLALRHLWEYTPVRF
jgi:hypothetical protein